MQVGKEIRTPVQHSTAQPNKKKETVRFALALLDKPIEDACESSTPTTKYRQQYFVLQVGWGIMQKLSTTEKQLDAP